MLIEQASGVLMSRNGLYAVIAVLLVAIVGYGIYSYQQQQARPGIEVRVDEQGISIDGNG
jgi:hypothetical protein